MHTHSEIDGIKHTIDKGSASQTWPVLQDLPPRYEDIDEHRRTPGEKSTREQLLRTLSELRYATGFDSYQAYLETRSKSMFDEKHLGEISAHNLLFSIANPSWEDRNNSIIKIVQSDNGNTKVQLHCDSEPTASTLISALQTSFSSDLLHRIVLLQTPLTLDYVDTFGVSFALDPSFFTVESPIHQTCLRPTGFITLEHLKVNIAITRHFALARGVQLPLLLVAGKLLELPQEYSPEERVTMQGDEGHTLTTIPWVKRVNSGALGDLTYEGQVEENNATNDTAPDDNAGNDTKYIYDDLSFRRIYCRALATMLLRSQAIIKGPEHILLASLLAFVDLDMLHLREYMIATKRLFYRELESKNENIYSLTAGDLTRDDHQSYQSQMPECLYRWRTRLRSYIASYEDQQTSLPEFVALEMGPELLKSELYQQFKASRDRMVEEARRFEAQLFDHLQLEASRLALLESRKSIELSNHQILEGKRVTILAFLYVPLNLATSVFGMNIQELNNSGRTLKVFFATAIIAVAVTGLIWWMIEEAKNFKAWRDEINQVQDVPQPHLQSSCTFMIRLYMIGWLVRAKCFTWSLRTGAVFCLLRKSGAPYFIHQYSTRSMPHGPASDETPFQYLTEIMIHREQHGYYYARHLIHPDEPTTGAWDCFEMGFIHSLMRWCGFDNPVYEH
ncbi:uncharacterized protein KY384_006722 [Bacidia gigantensis]|uniref:uncharacterized protein n=1 Tax=Bacidia gigantensis TaxID=2732470 RepID=UPI001D03A37A|nr:uncharacterized protein KY384_006722 [Bacidia gigantensis]KAG8529032.1 hypothetical protein KY384_006722 [Bacidia gigantensis]